LQVYAAQTLRRNRSMTMRRGPATITPAPSTLRAITQ